MDLGSFGAACAGVVVLFAVVNALVLTPVCLHSRVFSGSGTQSAT